MSFFDVRTVPFTPLDGAIPFEPSWIWAYQSLYVLAPLMPWLARRREELWCYTRGFVLISLVAFVLFVLMPVESPRPDVQTQHRAYDALVSLDGKGNAFPSLHAGLTIYTFLFGYRLFRRGLDRRGRLLYIAAATVWTTLILYATIATRQHWTVDLLAGILLGIVGHWWAWRGEPAGAGTDLVLAGGRTG